MSQYYYSDERNVQMLVALLKAHGVKHVVASPGATNINFVWSVQQDPFFKVFSAVDERHAAYLACGMAAELNTPVVLSCTGATASRNYFPGLTEAYYRKLPVLAITSMQRFTRGGNLSPQFLDRTVQPRDTVVCSIQCKIPLDTAEERQCELNLNKALIALTRHGGGPVHINLETSYSQTFSTKELPPTRVITHTMPTDASWREIPSTKRVGVFIGAHRPFAEAETTALEAFVKAYDAPVFVDKTSGYHGFGAIDAALLSTQGFHGKSKCENLLPEILIHIGEISGDYASMGIASSATEVWRVNEDGELRDTFGKLSAVFEMPESAFFAHYTREPKESLPLLQCWDALDHELRTKLPELPFSNPWIAQQLAPRLPEGSALHLGILNSLRSWNLFHLPKGVTSTCNVGGFGIDGIVSTAIGASLASPEKTFFVVVGDLAFFYDLNALGNRHVGKNLRILLVNNATGAEFHLYNHPAYKFNDNRKAYMAADGHFGNHSRDLVKHYAQDLGLTYLAADSKESFNEALTQFLATSEKSILLECFTMPEDESNAHKLINEMDPAPVVVTARSVASKVLPVGVKSLIKKVIS